MSTISDFDDLGRRLPELVRFGTSTWTYPGWKGLVYSHDYPATGSAAAMLAEYARHPLFGTVGIDSFFYRPPAPKTLHEYARGAATGFPVREQGLGTDHGAHVQLAARGGASWRAESGLAQCRPVHREVLDPMRTHFGEHLGPLIFEFQAIGKARIFPAASSSRRSTAFSGPCRLTYGMRSRCAIRSSSRLRISPCCEITAQHTCSIRGPGCRRSASSSCSTSRSLRLSSSREPCFGPGEATPGPSKRSRRTIASRRRIPRSAMISSAWPARRSICEYRRMSSSTTGRKGARR